MSFQNCKVVSIGANPREYHESSGERGKPDFVVSSSMLREFATCPLRWVHGYKTPDSDAKDFGSLLDCRLLTPNQFGERYSVAPKTYMADGKKKGDAPIEKPWNWNATVCKEWRESKEGREVVTANDIAAVDKAVARLHGDEILNDWLNECDTQVWVKGEWQDKATGLIIPVQVLLDFVPRLDSQFSKCLGDLKSIRNGGLMPFQRQVFHFGWHVQAAFYLALYSAATGEDRNSWCFVAVENYEPFEPCRRLLSQELLAIGEQTYKATLRRYAACLKAGKWEGYDDHADSCGGWSLVAAEPWMEYAALSEQLEADQTSALAEPDDSEVVP